MSTKQPKQQHSNELSCDDDKPERTSELFQTLPIHHNQLCMVRALHNFVDVNGMAEEKENNR